MSEVREAECMALSMKCLWLNWLLDGIRDAKEHRGAVANLLRESAHIFAGTCCASDSRTRSHSHGVINVACSEACDRTRRRCEKLHRDHDAQFRTTDVVARPGRGTTRCSGSCHLRGEFVQATVRGISMRYTVLPVPRIMLLVHEKRMQEILSHLMPRCAEVTQAMSQVLRDLQAETCQGHEQRSCVLALCISARGRVQEHSLYGWRWSAVQV